MPTEAMTGRQVSIPGRSGQAMTKSSIPGDDVPPRIQSGIDVSAKRASLRFS